MKHLLFLIIVIAIFASSHAAIGQDKVGWSSFSMGYGVSTGQGSMVQSIVGQSFVGKSGNATSGLEMGFLVGHNIIEDAINQKNIIPLVYSLQQNYPNPFNPATTITYALPHKSMVVLRVYNLLGQMVDQLVEGIEEPGAKTVRWDAGNFPSGVYFYMLAATNISAPGQVFMETKKMIIVK